MDTNNKGHAANVTPCDLFIDSFDYNGGNENDHPFAPGVAESEFGESGGLLSELVSTRGEGKTKSVDSVTWPEPLPLYAKVDPEPYPIDALPEPIRAAVAEVASFVKAPVPMVASCALTALSVASQAHVDVKRAEKLQGPVGLFMLTIADSGERKSTCDSFFSQAIREFEAAEAEAAKPELKNYKAAYEAWEAKYNGIKDDIRRKAKERKSTVELEANLRDLEHDKPQHPRIPRLLYADATPEALAYSLANQWPSGGIVSAEAGIVFGSHGMGKESSMRAMALYNILWDGASMSTSRRTAESFTVRGARLTMGLQVQETTLRAFMNQSSGLARGTGFLARFLVSWPESTQGSRMFSEPPVEWPHLSTFNRRIAAILKQPVPIDEDGALSPAMLTLTPEAKALWVDCHNSIEAELAGGGDLYDVRDVASKTADNIARLAALFHMMSGEVGAIGYKAMEGACKLGAWHLHESRRFFGEFALPVELADAARLESWLISYCKREHVQFVGKSTALQYGPLRTKSSIEPAITELVDLDRLWIRKEGKRILLLINPSLLGFATAKTANSANDGSVSHGF